MILGNAPTNLADKCGVGFGKCTVEGLTVPGYPAADCTYGGSEPHDNSGIIRYNSLRYGGDEIGNSNELNGISLAGVGDGTTIDNVEVFTNFDDGFEWFGGTVNGSHLAVFFQGDDAFDLDEGYTGVNQFLFDVRHVLQPERRHALRLGVGRQDRRVRRRQLPPGQRRPERQRDGQGARRSRDHGSPAEPAVRVQHVEHHGDRQLADGSAGVHAGLVRTRPTSACQWRNGAAGNVFNSIVTNTGTQKTIILDTDANGRSGLQRDQNAAAGLSNVVCTTLANGAVLAAAENLLISNGNALNLVLGGTAAGADTVYSAGFNNLVNRDQTFDPQATRRQARCLAQGHAAQPAPRGRVRRRRRLRSAVRSGPGPLRDLPRRVLVHGADRCGRPGWTAMNKAGLLAN